MKLSYLSICLFLFFITGNTNGQTRHEPYIGYGYFSLPAMTDTYSKLLPADLTGETYQFDEAKSSGTIYIGYNYNQYDFQHKFKRNNRVKYGIRIGMEKASNDLYLSGKKEGEWTATFVTVLASLRYRYVNKPGFQMYSGVEVGMCMMFEQIDSKLENTSDNSAFFAFQADMIGVRFGNEFGVFVEVGAGFMGVINGGFSYQF